MSTTQITQKIEDLLELEKLMDETKAEADILRNEIKGEMHQPRMKYRKLADFKYILV